MAWKKKKWHGKKLKFIGNLFIFLETVPTRGHHQANLPPQQGLSKGNTPFLGQNPIFVFGADFLHAGREKWKDTSDRKRNSIRIPE